jgi:hypothetical protein
MIFRVKRGLVPWLVAIPLMVAGSLSAHEVSYWLVVPDAAARATVLEASGHGYLSEAPLVLGVLGAVLLAALAGRVVSSLRGAAPARLAPLPVFLVPLLGFALQEHLERLLHAGELPVSAALEPTFLIGLALQLPFALAALMIARMLVHAADEVARALVADPPRPTARPIRAVRHAARDAVSRPRVAALGFTERGPPIAA